MPVIIGLLMPGLAWGQETAPGFEQRVLLENENVYAVENTYEPGAASSLHTHRFPRMVYVVEGGTLEVVTEDGETSRIELQPGLTVWLPPQTHVVKNVGDSRVRVVEVEVKSAA